MRQHQRRDLPLFAKYPTDKKIGIGVVNHCNTVVEPPEHVAQLIRKALEYIPPERLVITTDCGFGREGLSRRIAYYKCVALVEGTNIVRRELGLPEARVRAADPRLYFASAAEYSRHRAALPVGTAAGAGHRKQVIRPRCVARRSPAGPPA